MTVTDLDTLYRQRESAMGHSLHWSQELVRLRGLYVGPERVQAVQEAITRAERLQDLASAGAAKLTLRIVSHKDCRP